MKNAHHAAEPVAQERAERLSRLASYLQQAAEDERQRLADALHRDFGGLLTAAKFDLARIRQRAPEGAVAPLLAHLGGLLDECVALTRQTCEALRPSALRHLGLLPALEILVREWRSETALPVQARLRAVHVDAAQALAVYRLVQQALGNVREHAAASHVTVDLHERGDQVEVVVADDGCGFDPATADAAPRGLMALRHRLENLGGTLLIDSAPGRSTRLVARLPRANAAG